MVFSVKQRVLLPILFDENKDDLTGATVQRSIRQLINIDDAEAKVIELVINSNGTFWNPIKATDIEIFFNDVQCSYLKESVYNMSKARLITQDLLPLCEMIYCL